MSSNIPVATSLDALAVGRTSSASFITVFETRDPTSNDVNYSIQQRWFNTALEREWILVGFRVIAEVKTAIWDPISSSVTTETLTGNSGGAVAVDASNNINVIGDGTTVNVVGNPGTHTLTISTVSGTSIVETLTGNSGGAVSPTAGNINVVGDGTTISIVGNPGTSTLTASLIKTSLFTSINIQLISNTGTYTPTAGMLYCIIECVGGGGAGGGAIITGMTTVSCGGGGGGGEYTRAIFSAATIGASKAVTIGAGGTAVSGMAGGNGGTTSVGSTLISAVGGTGGAVSVASATGVFGSPGQGGTGGTGSILSIEGNNGTLGNATTGGGFSIGGNGGSSFLGIDVGMGAAAGTGQFAGGAAAGYGAGGGGAANGVSQSAIAGGNGFHGVVVITEFI